MDARTCIETRMSVRGFTDQAVEPSLLNEVMAMARWSPSYKNSQPWEVMIVSGGKKKALSEMLLGLLEAGEKAAPDLAAPDSWPEREQALIDHLYASRKEATGLDLNDPKIIVAAKKANFRFYNAPHGIFLYQDASLSSWSLFDLGLFAQSLMLAAHARGLGTVPQAFLTDYAAQTKEFLGIDAGKRLVLGLSVGYPDPESPANQMRTDRMEVDDFLTWAE